MQDIAELLEIYDLIISKYNDQPVQNYIKDYLNRRLISLYNKRKSQYDLRRSKQTEHDIKYILNWLIKNNPVDNVVYAMLLKAFLDQLITDQKTADGLPLITRFKPDRNYIVSGVPVELSWSISNAEDISVLQEEEPVLLDKRSYVVVYPLAAGKPAVKKYTLIIRKGPYKDEKEVQVVVFPVPMLEVINTPFPKINLTTELAINVAMPKMNLPNTLPSLLKRVSFYPKLLDDLHHNDATTPKHKSIFNIYFLYGRIREGFRKRRNQGI